MSNEGCIAQTYWYDDDGAQRARFCDELATVEVRALDGSRNRLCDEHGRLALEAGATLLARA